MHASQPGVCCCVVLPSTAASAIVAIYLICDLATSTAAANVRRVRACVRVLAELCLLVPFRRGGRYFCLSLRPQVRPAALTRLPPTLVRSYLAWRPFLPSCVRRRAVRLNGFVRQETFFI